MHLVQVPPEAIDPIWPKAEPFIERACEYSRGSLTASVALHQIKNDGRQLWIIVNDSQPREVTAAGMTSIQQMPTGAKFLQIELLGGNNVKEWFDLKDLLEKWAKEQGCSGVLAWARKGWAKHMPDYQMTHYLMHKDL